MAECEGLGFGTIEVNVPAASCKACRREGAQNSEHSPDCPIRVNYELERGAKALAGGDV